MNANDIKLAVESGQRVFWKNRGYEVKRFKTRDGEGQWLVVCSMNNNCIGLTHRDGVTLNGTPSDFFIA